jgi:dihydrodipicolinate synthase/N-acetylneuraminate lyase
MALANVPLFSGVIPALITPFHPDGGVNVDVVPELVQYQIDAGVSGFYVCGNTGEGFACSVDERKAMLEAVLKANGGKVPTMVHVGACPVADAIALALHAKEARRECASFVIRLGHVRFLPCGMRVPGSTGGRPSCFQRGAS